MGIKEFLQKYPQWQFIYDSSWKEKVPGSKGNGITFINAPCCMCGSIVKTRMDHLVARHSEDGVYYCPSCMTSKRNTTRIEQGTHCFQQPAIREKAKTALANRTPEQKQKSVEKLITTMSSWSEDFKKDKYDRMVQHTDYSANNIKAQATRKANGYYESEHWHDAARRSFETRLANNSAFRNPIEYVIDEEFGSIHYSDGYFELDCYWPDKGLAIEVEDKSHYETGSVRGSRTKEQGYHYKKDMHYKAKGVTILHIWPATMGPNWRDTIQSFLDGTYNGPLIDLSNPYYGDIVYEG